MRKLLFLSAFFPLVSLGQHASVDAASSASEQISSAFAVETKQGAVTASVASDGERISRQQLSASIDAIKKHSRVIDAFSNYSPELGQPKSLNCEALANGELFVRTANQSRADRAKLLSAYVNKKSNSDSGRGDRLKSRFNYCSPSEARQGMCEISPHSSLDSDYSKITEQKTFSPALELAAMDYAENLASNQVEADSFACKSASCASVSNVNSRALAVNSMIASAIISQSTDRRLSSISGE